MSNDNHNDPIPFIPEGKGPRKRDKKPKNKDKRQRREQWEGHIKASDKSKKWFREAS